MYWTRHQDGWTALHCAARGGHTELARLLLDRGADVNSQDKVGDMTRVIVMIVSVIDCFV